MLDQLICLEIGFCAFDKCFYFDSCFVVVLKKNNHESLTKVILAYTSKGIAIPKNCITIPDFYENVTTEWFVSSHLC